MLFDVWPQIEMLAFVHVTHFMTGRVSCNGAEFQDG